MTRVTTPTPPAKPVTASTVKVPHDRIAMRAYEKWMKRGCPQGTALQDWMEAEAELMSEYSRGTSSASTTRR